jgi:hypothetical protein
MREQIFIQRLEEFLETGARSCSMDFGCVTPLYAYRMLGGQFSMEDIEVGLRDIRKTLSSLRGFRESGI